MDEQPPRVDRPAVSWWASWCDGLWLGVGLAIAISLAFYLPSAVLTRTLKTAEEGVLGSLVKLVGGGFLLIVSPVIFSRVFREIDYPGGGCWSVRRSRPDVLKDETIDV